MNICDTCGKLDRECSCEVSFVYIAEAQTLAEIKATHQRRADWENKYRTKYKMSILEPISKEGLIEFLIEELHNGTK